MLKLSNKLRIFIHIAKRATIARTVPSRSGGITRSEIKTPNAKSALGGKGVKRKLKVQILVTKYEVIVAVEKGERERLQLPNGMAFPLTPCLPGWKIKEKIMNAFQSVTKNTKTSTISDIEEATLKWFKSDRDKNVPVSDSLLATKSEAFDIAIFLSIQWLAWKVRSSTGES